MADVFVSYSRRDGEFVRKLVEGLETAGKDVWLDVHGIRDAEVFPEALRTAIENSDGFLFVISPDAVASRYCAQEVEHARRLCKRIVPIMHRPVPDAQIPPAIRERNWIPLGDEADLGEGLGRVVQALDTDLEWARAHTRWLVKALEWEAEDRDRSFLLRGRELASAERWLAGAPGKEPFPTALQRDYVAASRAAAGRRQRTVTGVSLAVAAVSIALLVFALVSRQDAVQSAVVADSQRLGAQALLESRLDRSLLLAMVGVGLHDSTESRGNLLAALVRNPAAIGELHGDGDRLLRIALSRDGEQLAIGDNDGTVTLFSPATHERLRTLELGFPVFALEFSPDGRSIAAGGNDEERGHLRLLDWRTGRDVTRLKGASRMSSSGITFSRDGRRIYALGDPDRQLLSTRSELMGWRVRTGLPLRRAVAIGKPGRDVELTRGGRLLVPLGDEVQIRHPRTFRLLHSEGIRASALARSPTEPVLALGQKSGELRFLDERTGRTRRGIGRHLGEVSGIDFTPDGRRLVTTASDGQVGVWDVARRELAEMHEGHGGTVQDQVLSSDGRTLYTASSDSTVIIWDVAGDRRLARPFRVGATVTGCPFMALVEDGRTLAAPQADGTVALVDAGDARRAGAIQAYRDQPACIVEADSAGRRIVVTPYSGLRVKVFDVSTGRRVGPALATRPPAVQHAVLSSSGRIAAAAREDGSVDLWDLPSGRARPGPPPAGSPAVYLSFSPDGRRLAASIDDGRVIVSSTSTGRRLAELRGHEDGAVATRFSPDGRFLAVGGRDGRWALYDSAGWRRLGPRAGGHAGWIISAEFSPGGRMLATTGTDGQIRLWDVDSRRPIGRALPGPEDNRWLAARFGPHDGRLYTYADNSEGQVWQATPDAWLRHACEVAGRDFTPAEWRDVAPERDPRPTCGQAGGE